MVDTFELKWQLLLQSKQVDEIEALVFGVLDWFVDIVSMLANAKNYLPNLKAVFLGDIEDRDCMISSLPQYDDISSILLSYAQLEHIHVRCNNGRNGRTGEKRPEGMRFCSPLQHNYLKVLRIESGGLNSQTLIDISQLELPSLEYLELWLGAPEYGGNSSINDLMLIISGQKFPKLRYLGLRNCDYTDEIATQLATSPLIRRLTELDLSMGTLGDEGLLALLNSPFINELDVLNVSQNYITTDFIEKILPRFELDCQIVVDRQQCSKYVEPIQRYCAVAE
ncbi:hypothetical protein [Chamaesiphon polymorphus]|uniref:hypothetical protein n=1 Tax=Chamaesiphon polymorphus TaxID=2107691 RepID=UPI0011B21F5E|nr:hypothetical protein [Chamaesiphon polymorphus]